MSVNEKINEITKLKKELSQLRDNSIQAKATMKEVNNYIEITTNELKKLGVEDVSKVDEYISDLNKSIDKSIEEAKEVLEKWSDKK